MHDLHPAMMIDRYLPVYDFREYHDRNIEGEIDRVYDIVRNFRFANSRVTELLLRLRGFSSGRLSLQNVLDAGFLLLEERTNDEIVLGLAGKFWTPSGCLQRLTPDEFRNFRTEGFARAAWNFRFVPGRIGTTRLSTETRTLCHDPKSKKLFSFYWFFIRPFSGVIRREMLRSIQQSLRQ